MQSKEWTPSSCGNLLLRIFEVLSLFLVRSFRSITQRHSFMFLMRCVSDRSSIERSDVDDLILSLQLEDPDSDLSLSKSVQPVCLTDSDDLGSRQVIPDSTAPVEDNKGGEELLPIKDRWHKMRPRVNLLAETLCRSRCKQIRKKGLRVRLCGLPDPENGSVRYCDVRICPICQRRRQCKFIREFKETAREVTSCGNFEFLFLTVALPNIPVAGIREWLDTYNTALRDLTKSPFWMGKGWVVGREFSDADNMEVHPHFHLLVAFDGNVAGTLTLTDHKNWSDAIRTRFELTDPPHIRMWWIRASTPEQCLYRFMRRFCYLCKAPRLSNLTAEECATYIEQLRKAQLTTFGGIFSGYEQKFLKGHFEVDSEDEAICLIDYTAFVLQETLGLPFEEAMPWRLTIPCEELSVAAGVLRKIEVGDDRPPVSITTTRCRHRITFSLDRTGVLSLQYKRSTRGQVSSDDRVKVATAAQGHCVSLTTEERILSEYESLRRKHGRAPGRNELAEHCGAGKNTVSIVIKAAGLTFGGRARQGRKLNM